MEGHSEDEFIKPKRGGAVNRESVTREAFRGGLLSSR